MNKQLFDSLEALCMMWEQYCDGENGHFWSTGKNVAFLQQKIVLKSITFGNQPVVAQEYHVLRPFPHG